MLLTSTLALLVAWSVAFGATAITGLVVPLAAEMAAVGLVGRTRAERALAQETTGNRRLQPTDGGQRTHAGQGDPPRSTGMTSSRSPALRRSVEPSQRYSSATCFTRSNW